MRYADYQHIDPYATDLQLVIADLIHPPVTFGGLTVVQARCVTTGVPNAADAIYLVQITDARGVLFNPWFSQLTTSQYNVRSPAYPQQYYSQTMNGAAAWTWDEMIGNLWQQMPLLGTYPGLPIVPVGTPDGWRFPGMSCWQALNQVLDQQGLVLTADLTLDEPYGIVQAGSVDTAFDTFLANNIPEDDFAYIDAGSGRAPGTVTVLFHRRNEYYGTEETVRRDSLQWDTTPLYQVTVTATDAGFPSFASAVGQQYLWADFTVRYDTDNNPLAADVVTAAAVAIDQANAYYNLTQRATSGYMRKVFTGAQPLGTSGQLDGVRWMQTIMDPQRGGWRMECIRGYFWPEVMFCPDGISGE